MSDAKGWADKGGGRTVKLAQERADSQHDDVWHNLPQMARQVREKKPDKKLVPGNFKVRKQKVREDDVGSDSQGRLMRLVADPHRESGFKVTKWELSLRHDVLASK